VNPSNHKPETHPVFIIAAFVLVTGAALYFSPTLDTELTTENVRTTSLFDEKQQMDFSVRIYNEEQEESKALVLIIPPLTDSFQTVDKICAEMSKNGFVTATFSRKKPTLKERSDLSAAVKKGVVLEKANETGRYWENVRLSDITFICSHLEEITQKPLPVFAVGYEAGGSALILAASSPDFIKEVPSLKAVVAVESRFWSLFYHEDTPLEIPEDISRIRRAWLNASAWFNNLLPKKVNRIADAPVMQIPGLFLVSDIITRSKQRDGAYIALLRTVHAPGAAPAVLIAGNGMGRLDYSDYPAIQPLYSALNRGAGKRVWNRNECIVNTAKIITSFASEILNAPSTETGFSDTGAAIFKNVYIEKNEAWNSDSFIVY
jgi:hypothetical protein